MPEDVSKLREKIVNQLISEGRSPDEYTAVLETQLVAKEAELAEFRKATNEMETRVNEQLDSILKKGSD